MALLHKDWIGFHLGLLVLLAAEFLFARHQRRRNKPASTRGVAVVTTIGWLAVALGFAGLLAYARGLQPATEFLAGYSIEQALSVDNLFVFLLLFRAFRVEPVNQPRVLFWGVAGAILMRGLFIALGIGLLEHFHWVSYLFGAVLLVAAIRLLVPKDENRAGQPPRWIRWLSRVHPVSLSQEAFLVRENGRMLATVLLLCLIAIELTDVVFALDSIPAVLSITRDPFLAYTSNILAVMGLRSLFFVLLHLLERLSFLHFGLAAVLAFAALKMLAAPWLSVGPLLSLAIVLGILLLTAVLSLSPLGRPK